MKIMINIAIVEDIPDVAETIQKYVLAYGNETKAIFSIKKFANAITFLSEYNTSFDLVFMDIKMPHMNGMEAAKRLRELNSEVEIVFITSLAQYAIEGYSVNALSYILKPVKYADLKTVLRKYEKKKKNVRQGNILTLKTDGGIVRINSVDIIYIDISAHNLCYHLENKEYSKFGTLNEEEEELKGFDFVRCDACFLVNLRYVESVQRYVCTLKNKQQLKISRSKYKDFLNAFVEYRSR